MKLSSLLIAVLAASSGAAFAQATQQDSAWRGNLAYSLALAKGNTQSTNSVLAADTSRATEADKITLYASNLSARANSIKTGNATTFGGRYDRNLSPSLFVFGAADFEKDSIKQLKLRTTLGSGVGLHVVNNANTTFDVYGGLAWMNSKYNTGLESKSGVGLILGEESTHKLSADTSFKQKLVLYPTSGNTRAVFEAGFQTALAANMNLQVSLINKYNSKVPAGIKKSDMLFFTGVNMAFGPK